MVTKGFISYCHEDHQALRELRKHLRPLERLFAVNFWADKRILTGDYWSAEIAKAIELADIYVLLVSPAFFDSDYIYDKELPAIRKRYSEGALVLPIVWKRCCWEAVLGALQASPTNSAQKLVPIRDWRPIENGFDAARCQLMAALQHFLGAAPVAPTWNRL